MLPQRTVSDYNSLCEKKYNAINYFNELFKIFILNYLLKYYLE